MLPEHMGGMKMKIRQINARLYQVLLTGEELKEKSLTFERMDCDGKETQELLVSIITLLRADGFEPGEKVFIEVYPTQNGGCAIFFSTMDGHIQKRWKVHRHVTSPVIYGFNDVDLLITGAVQLFRRCSHRILKSALYKVNGGWRLLIYPLDTLENISLSLMDEFAPRCGEGVLAEAFLSEHAQLLLKENAVDFLSACFG